LDNPYPISDWSVHKAGIVRGRAEGKHTVKTAKENNIEVQIQKEDIASAECGSHLQKPKMFYGNLDLPYMILES